MKKIKIKRRLSRRNQSSKADLTTRKGLDETEVSRFDMGPTKWPRAAVAIHNTGRVSSDRGILDNLLAVSVESEIEKPHALHEFFRLAQFPFATKESIDKFNSGILP